MCWLSQDQVWNSEGCLSNSQDRWDTRSFEWSKMLCSLDLHSGYLQVGMWEGGSASTTPFHLNQFSRIPFRLTNAPATFQRLMERCLAGLNLKIYLICCHYIIVFSDTLNETLKRLEIIVLKHLCDFGLKLKTAKYKHFYTKLLSFPYHVPHKKLQTTVATDRVQGKGSRTLFTWALTNRIRKILRTSWRSWSHSRDEPPWSSSSFLYPSHCSRPTPTWPASRRPLRPQLQPQQLQIPTQTPTWGCQPVEDVTGSVMHSGWVSCRADSLICDSVESQT